MFRQVFQGCPFLFVAFVSFCSSSLGKMRRNVFPRNTRNTRKDEKMCQTPLSASFCVVCGQKPVLIIRVNPCHPCPATARRQRTWLNSFSAALRLCVRKAVLPWSGLPGFQALASPFASFASVQEDPVLIIRVNPCHPCPATARRQRTWLNSFSAALRLCVRKAVFSFQSGARGISPLPILGLISGSFSACPP